MEHQQITRTELKRKSRATIDQDLAAQSATHPAVDLQRKIGNQKVQRLMQDRTQESPALPHLEVVYREEASRYLVSLDGIPVAEIAVANKDTWLKIDANITESAADIVVSHYGDANLLPATTAVASLRVQVHLREVDLRQAEPEGGGRVPPAAQGEEATGKTKLAIGPPNTLPWLSGQGSGKLGGELELNVEPPPGLLTEFEERVRADPSLISGVIFDPDDPGQVIGYKLRGTTGVTELVDREGNMVWMTEIGIEQPLLDPIDFIPTPGTLGKVGRAGAGIGGRALVKRLGKKAAVEGTEVSLGAIARMRAVSRALLSRVLRKGAEEAPGFVRKIARAGLEHSFDSHAAQWFGRAVTRETHFALWRELIERAAASGRVFPWSSGTEATIAHLARIENKWFVVQFSRETGELVTAFIPNSSQLGAMLKLLKGVP
jgi:hypothetical protein